MGNMNMNEVHSHTNDKTHEEHEGPSCCHVPTADLKKPTKNVSFLTKIRYYFYLFNPYLTIFFFNMILLQLLFIILPNNPFLEEVFAPKGATQITIGTLAMFFLYPRFIEGTWKGLKRKQFGMMFMIMLSVTVAYFLSFVLFILNFVNNEEKTLYFDAAVAILVFLTIGIMIEEKISKQGKYDIQSILKLKNPKVLTIQGNLVKLEDIKKGDLIVINKDSDILVDGLITKGDTYVSESFLTGEAYPIKKTIGSQINAGSTNLGHRIIVEVQNTLEKSNISRIVKQAQQLAKSKPKIQKIADSIAKYMIIIEFIALVFAFLYKYFVIQDNLTDAIIFSISVFVLACPCALGILTPGVLMLSSSTLNKKNILIKNKDIFEKIKNIKVAAFDKTGTVVSSVLTIGNWNGNDLLLSIIKGMEITSNHPIAKALLGFKPQLKAKVLEEVKEMIGIGLQGKYKDNWYYLGGKKLIEKLKIDYSIKEHEIVLIFNQQVVASFRAISKINPRFHPLIRALKKFKIHTTLLSGDFQKSVDELNNEVQFDLALGELSPMDKADQIRMLQQEKGRVLYVGDGINDIVALSKADISVAIASDYNAFNIPSDVIIFNDEVANVWPMMDILSKTRKYVAFGISWAFIYNLIVLITAVFIDISPALAAAIMAGSDLVILMLILGYRLLKLDKKNYYKTDE